MFGFAHFVFSSLNPQHFLQIDTFGSSTIEQLLLPMDIFVLIAVGVLISLDYGDFSSFFCWVDVSDMKAVFWIFEVITVQELAFNFLRG